MWQRKIVKRVVLLAIALAVFSPHAFPASDPPLSESAVADKVIVLKGFRKLMLMKGDEVLKTYVVWLGGEPVGPKIKQGDNKTPEGIYVLDRHNAHSQYYR